MDGTVSSFEREHGAGLMELTFIFSCGIMFGNLNVVDVVSGLSQWLVCVVASIDVLFIVSFSFVKELTLFHRL